MRVQFVNNTSWHVEVPEDEVPLFTQVLNGVRKYISRDSDGAKHYEVPVTYSSTHVLVSLGARFPAPGAWGIFNGMYRVDDGKFPWKQFKKATRGLPLDPMTHQRAAIDKFHPMRAGAIYHQPGTGKTFTYITMACSWFPAVAAQVIVVCPNAVVENWPEELEKYAWVPIEVFKYEGASSRARIARAMAGKPTGKMRWLIISIESLSSGGGPAFMHDFAKKAPTAMVVDESQFIKNWKAGRTKDCIKTGKICVRRHLMTGSPITQKMEELYAAGLFLDDRILGYSDFWPFRNRYCVMGGFKRKQVVDYDNVEELMMNLGPFTHIVDKRQALPDLPPKLFENRYYQLTEQQLRMIESIEGRRIIGEHEIKNVLEAFLRMHQVCGGVVPDDFDSEINDNPKLEAVIAAIRDEFTTDQIVVWCKFVQEVDIVCERLKELKIPHLSLTGRVERERRQELLTEFSENKHRVAVANPASLGVGVDKLKTAEVALFYSNSFSWNERMQAEDRTHRKGVVGPKRLYVDFIAKGSVDEYVKKCLDQRMDVADAIKKQLEIAGRILL